MTVYVMTLADRQPSGYFPLEEGEYNVSEPPWAFSGYCRMKATTTEEAKLEFEAATAPKLHVGRLTFYKTGHGLRVQWWGHGTTEHSDPVPRRLLPCERTELALELLAGRRFA